MDLANKTVLITGGAKRIGRCLVEQFAKLGLRVAFTYRSSEKEAKGLAKTLKGNAVQIYRAELGEKNDVKKIQKDLQKKWGGVDILINSASDFYSTPLLNLTEQDWHHFIKVNLTGPFLFAWIFGLEMKKKGTGKIINIADWAAEKPCKNYLPYGVSKTGLLGLTKALACELAPEVCVNAISPGPVLPPSGASASEIKKLAQSVPLKKIGSAIDVAQAALYLAQADYVTGSILTVDGGRLIL